MGTHPIFESDFDCLTERLRMNVEMNESSRVLESNGLYVDDLSRIRVLDPETADASESTKAAADHYVADFNDFVSMINDFTAQADAMAEQVKQRKLKAIGTRTKLQAIDRENAVRKINCCSELKEHRELLDRLRGEHEALKRVEQSQQTILQQMNE